MITLAVSGPHGPERTYLVNDLFAILSSRGKSVLVQKQSPREMPRLEAIRYLQQRQTFDYVIEDFD
jgi:hypothetical protein